MGWQAEAVCGVILGDRGGRRGGPDLRCEGEHEHGRELLLHSWCYSACTSSLKKTHTCSALTNARSGWGRVPSVPVWAGRGFGGGFEEPQLPLRQAGPYCGSVA